MYQATSTVSVDAKFKDLNRKNLLGVDKNKLND